LQYVMCSRLNYSFSTLAASMRSRASELLRAALEVR
jgi:hypothetical protein